MNAMHCAALHSSFIYVTSQTHTLQKYKKIPQPNYSYIHTLLAFIGAYAPIESNKLNI